MEQYLLLLEIKPSHKHREGKKHNNDIQMNYAKELMEILITFGNESGLSVVA